MSDFLVQLGANKSLNSVLKRIGVKLPLPQELQRTDAPWSPRPLQGLQVLVGETSSAQLSGALSKTLATAGASLHLTAPQTDDSPWRLSAEAWSASLQELPTDEAVKPKTMNALVFDASGVETSTQLDAVYRFFHLQLKSLVKCGRILVLSRPAGETDDVETATTRQALVGFVKSLAKEYGGKGITANLLTVSQGGEAAIEGPVRWFLSPRSAFVTGQVLPLKGGAVSLPIPWAKPLKGKVAVVTGAARGIGAATATSLAREGAHVIVVDRPSEDGALQALATELGGTALEADVTQADAGKKIAALCESKGGLDIIVHNAGVTRDKTLPRMDQARWDLVMEINLRAIVRITSELDKVFNDGARILVLASIAGIAGNAGQTNYAATKAAMIGYARALSTQVSDRGITVNALAPGFIETQMTAAVPTLIREVGRRLAALAQGGLPQDVAETITFLSTPGAYGVSGQVLRVCGGNFLGA